MPYIVKADREALDDAIAYLVSSLRNLGDRNFEGNLNYAITVVAQSLIADTPGYKRINGIVGALECAKLELYRKIAAPYEDVKEAENGKVEHVPCGRTRLTG